MQININRFFESEEKSGECEVLFEEGQTIVRHKDLPDLIFDTNHVSFHWTKDKISIIMEGEVVKIKSV